MRAAKCHRIGVGEDGRPFCVHGPMRSHGSQKNGFPKYECGHKARNADIARYERRMKDPAWVEQDRLRHRILGSRYRQTEHGKEVRRRIDARKIRMFGEVFTAPDMEFREYAAQLRDARKEALRGRTQD